MTTTIKQGNCLELMKNLPDKSVDLLICDLPYGETNCKWDTIIDMEEFWKQFKRIRKSKRVACIHFCSTKFGYSLIKSWEKGFKMDMVWKKRLAFHFHQFQLFFAYYLNNYLCISLQQH